LISRDSNVHMVINSQVDVHSLYSWVSIICRAVSATVCNCHMPINVEAMDNRISRANPAARRVPIRRFENRFMRRLGKWKGKTGVDAIRTR
jgi:hypothetical protein